MNKTYDPVESKPKQNSEQDGFFSVIAYTMVCLAQLCLFGVLPASLTAME